jgi:hypothetical protein
VSRNPDRADGGEEVGSYVIGQEGVGGARVEDCCPVEGLAFMLIMAIRKPTH